ncbi:hypothetical protein L4C36_08655 [Photobacterium japonica]|uniref:hypothetical protein n=1 Tax=Photobacterium japonica TaxID=2910235 RepID=UPI003D09F4A0
MNKKSIALVVCLLPIAGCQSTVGSSYTYVPKQLSQAVIDDASQHLPQEHRHGTSLINIRFVESESYIEVSKTLDDGFGYIGGNFNDDVYTSLCGNQPDQFLDHIRSTGLGVKYVFIDDRGAREIGPWNTDICNTTTDK